MANILDYVRWRGDLDFESSCFNEIDNLILSQLVYIDFAGIVSDNNKNVLTLKDVSDIFFSNHDKSCVSLGVLLPKEIITLLELTGKSRRFGNMKLSCYVNHIDKEKQEQFSAMTFELNDGLFIAFRGTDDTLVGWKEDFNMCFVSPVPAQEESVEYLNHVLSLYTKRSGKIRLGGHSKGGNLAVYSATYCPKNFKKNIVAVYNNDGPGFDEAMMKNPLYQEILNKTTTFLPQSSTVGMLLSHEEPYIVIKSTASGLFQHNVFSWQLIGKEFVTASLSSSSKLLDKTLKNWLAGMDNKQRMRFVDILFEILAGDNAEKLKDLKISSINKLVCTMINMDNEDKTLLFKTIKQLLSIGASNLKEQLQHKIKEGLSDNLIT
jgi:hypothetical protein